MESKAQEILEAATQMVRTGGYNAFSFRTIADAVGIKSSSVHYHYPSKALLGAAVATYYSDRFMEALGEPKALIANGKDPIQVYANTFRNALTEDKRMCLCAILAAEADGLPEEVNTVVKAFFEKNIDWLEVAYTLQGNAKNPRQKAMQTLASLEGAMMMSNILRDIAVFDTISLTN